MARTRFWKRLPDASVSWPQAVQGNHPIVSVLEGETILRTIIDVRFYARTVDQGTSIPPDRMYVPYAFGLFYSDGTVPNPHLIFPLASADDYPDNWLHLERFTMTDANTPAKYTGVNVGFQDQRPSMTFESHAQRTGKRPLPSQETLIFCWQGYSTVYADPFILKPLVHVSCLMLSADT